MQHLETRVPAVIFCMFKDFCTIPFFVSQNNSLKTDATTKLYNREVFLKGNYSSQVARVARVARVAQVAEGTRDFHKCGGGDSSRRQGALFNI